MKNVLVLLVATFLFGVGGFAATMQCMIWHQKAAHAIKVEPAPTGDYLKDSQVLPATGCTVQASDDFDTRFQWALVGCTRLGRSSDLPVRSACWR